MAKTIRITPNENYHGVTDPNVLSTGTTVLNALTGNTNFPNTPVDLPTLKAELETYNTLISESKDGSKKIIALRNKQREVVIKMLRLLGRYVEVMCKDDPAIFNTSGFPQAVKTRTPVPPLSQYIRRIDHAALSGQLLVILVALAKAAAYDIRYAPVPPGGAPTAWTTVTVSLVKKGVTIAGLTPGTTYAFQVRVLEKNVYSDWSDSVTFMCN